MAIQAGESVGRSVVETEQRRLGCRIHEFLDVLSGQTLQPTPSHVHAGPSAMQHSPHVDSDSDLLMFCDGEARNFDADALLPGGQLHGVVMCLIQVSH